MDDEPQPEGVEVEVPEKQDGQRSLNRHGLFKPLTIHFNGISADTPLPRIRERLIWLKVLIENAARPDNNAVYSLKLKRTATIDFAINAVERKAKRIHTPRKTAEGYTLMSRSEAYYKTVGSAIMYLDAMIRYNDFAQLLEMIDTLRHNDPSVLDELPERHYSKYFRFNRPIYGTKYKELHHKLLKEKESYERRAAILEVIGIEKNAKRDTIREALQDILPEGLSIVSNEPT